MTANKKKKKKSGMSPGFIAAILAIGIGVGGGYYYLNQDKTPEFVAPIAHKDLPRKTLTPIDPCDPFKQAQMNCTVKWENNDSTPRGRLVRQTPPEGQVTQQTPVELFYSQGPTSAQLPELKGEGLEASRARLYAMGINSTSEKEIDANGVAQGKVVSVEGHKVGEEIKNGTDLTLLISSGFINVPNWRDETLKTAQISGEKLGIKIVPIMVNANEPPGTIIDQSVAPGRSQYVSKITVKVARAMPKDGAPIPKIINVETFKAIEMLRADGFQNIKTITIKDGSKIKTRKSTVLSVSPEEGTPTLRTSLVTIKASEEKK